MGYALGKRLFFSILLILPYIFSQAQSNLVFYHSNDQLNSPNLNPAFLSNQEKFTLSFFPISGISVGYNNQQVINKMLFDAIGGNQSKQQFQKVFRSMLKLDLFYQRMEFPLLNFGYNSKLGSFNFRIQDNMRLMTKLKGEMSSFLADPDVLSITLNKPQFFPIHAMYYREYSLGYSKNLMDNRLTFGIRAKAYFGKFSLISEVQGQATMENGSYKFKTQNNLKLSFPGNLDIKDSILPPIGDFAIGDFLFNSGNSGLGFDLGFNYKINPELEFSASLIDIGKINWKSNLNSIEYIGKYEFPAQFINVSESNNQTLTRISGFPAETLSIPDLFKVKSDSGSYSTSLPLIFFAGLKYKVSERLGIGIVNRFISTKDLSYNSISANAEIKIKESLKLITGFSAQGNSFTNIPLAIVYNWSGGQYFAGTDNMLSYIFPSFSDFSGITFGASIYLFQNRKDPKKEVGYLPFYEIKKRKKL